MVSRSRLLSVLAILFGFVGCGAVDDGDPQGNADTSLTADVAEADTAAVDPNEADATDQVVPDVAAPDTDGPANDFTSCTYLGRVVDEAGAPIEKATIVICGEEAQFCVKGTSKADGTWKVGGAKRLAMGIKVLGGVSGHTSVTLPQEPCATPETDLGDVVLFTPASGEVVTAVTGGPAQAHPDLRLDLPADLDFPNYEESTAVQAAEVDVSKMHRSLTAQITPLAAFAIVPYDTESPLPVPFDVKLPVASTTVGVYVLDYLTGIFLPLADVPVDAGGHARLATGGGLPQLTWVAFVAR